MEQKLQPIDTLLNSTVAKQVTENPMKCKSILKTVGIRTYPGVDTMMTPAQLVLTFLALLEFRAEAKDAVLAIHFQTTSSRSTYTFKMLLVLVDPGRSARSGVLFSHCGQSDRYFKLQAAVNCAMIC